MENLTKLPGSEEMDRCVLSCMMQAPEINFPPALEALKGGDFYTQECTILFDILKGMHSRQESVDGVTVFLAVKNAGLLDRIGASFVSEALTASPNPSHLKHYMEAVLDASRRRQAIRASSEILTACYKEGDWRSTVSPLLKTVELSLTQKNKKELRDIKTVVSDWTEAHTAAGDQGMDPPVSTGINGLNKLLVGGIRREYILIGGKQGHGKTLLGQQLGGHLANAGRAGLWVGWEMQDVQNFMRDLARESGVPLNIIMGREKTPNMGTYQTMARKAAHMGNHWKLKFTNDPYMNLDAVASHARDLKRQGILDYMVLDFLQLAPIAKSAGKRRDEELTDASNFIGRLQADLGITVIAMVQLNDDDLIRDARGILDAAGVNMRIKMDLRDDSEDEDTLDTGRIIVTKNRHGAMDRSCPVVRNGPLQRFDDGEFRKKEQTSKFPPRRQR